MSYRDDGYGRETWGRSHSARESRESLQPLVERLALADQLRVKLEREGGTSADIERVTRLFNEPFVISTRYGEHKVSLADQKALRRAVSDYSYQLFLEVRQSTAFLPLYYVARTKPDYWGAYDLVVEDLHLSPSYPMSDKRFARLTRMGHETYYLRLSGYRAGTARLLGAADSDDDDRIDELLYSVGRHVLAAAWHEDQQLAMSISTHFRLRHLPEAVELLYFSLSGDLCETRSALHDPNVTSFFARVYPNSALRTLLEWLPRLPGNQLVAISTKALDLYKKLAKSFGVFLQTEVSWGAGRMPLYKLILANFGRLGLVAPQLAGPLSDPIARLEVSAAGVIEEVLDLARAAAA